ncbi:DUF448 domain-containing protein [Candidatus Dojkabacteria bacterium]|nr:DUF448 domain-containing protein [Candidatus Dojkabacteria bacterium]
MAIRTCIVTRDKKPKSELWRFVFDKECATIELDLKGKKQGRGVYLTPDIEIYDLAVTRNAFKRAFKTGKITRENLDNIRLQIVQELEPNGRKSKNEDKKRGR